MNELINTSKGIKSTAAGCSLVIQDQNFMYLVSNAKLCKHSPLEEVCFSGSGKMAGRGTQKESDKFQHL